MMKIVLGFLYKSASFIPGGENAHFLTPMRTKCGPKNKKVRNADPMPPLRTFLATLPAPSRGCPPPWKAVPPHVEKKLSPPHIRFGHLLIK